MKGTNVTPEQLVHAEEFLCHIAHGTELRKGVTYYNTESLSLKRQDLIRLLAWYGAIRAESCNVAGVGKLTKIRKDETGA